MEFTQHANLIFIMADARLQADLEESKQEIRQLR